MILAALAALLLAGMIYQRIGIFRDARKFPPPGKLVDIGGLRLHANPRGSTSNAVPVILEAGIGATSLSWALVEEEIAKFAPVLSYDRAGLGWSDASSRPRDLAQLTQELRALLETMNIPAPRLIVAHSFGGLIALDYAARFPAEIAGLVLVDPAGVREWAEPDAAHRSMLQRGIFLARCGQLLAALGVVRFTLNRLAAGARRMPKLIAHATSGRGGAAFLERMTGEIQKLPRELWPAVQAHWSDGKCFDSLARYLHSLPESAARSLAEVASVRAPILVLSAGNSSPAQRADHERVAGLSPRGELRVVDGARHWIQLDAPEVVAQAVRDLLAP